MYDTSVLMVTIYYCAIYVTESSIIAGHGLEGSLVTPTAAESSIIAGQGLEGSIIELVTPTASTPKRVKRISNITTESATRSKNILCDHCSKSFTTKNGLSFHISMEHLDKPKFRCQICNKKFMGKTAYQTHIMQHGEVNI